MTARERRWRHGRPTRASEHSEGHEGEGSREREGRREGDWRKRGWCGAGRQRARMEKSRADLRTRTIGKCRATPDRRVDGVVLDVLVVGIWLDGVA